MTTHTDTQRVPPALLPDHVRVAIVGAGFAGLGMAIKLKRQFGLEDLVVLERRADVGGTWYDNTYPGCQCDVPSHLYSFSFAPNPDWSRAFSMQPEIEAYLQRCARDFDVRRHLHTGTEVLEMWWPRTALAGAWRPRAAPSRPTSWSRASAG